MKARNHGIYHHSDTGWQYTEICSMTSMLEEIVK